MADEKPPLEGFNLTPTYANTFNVAISKDAVRIAFGEAQGERRHFHTVVFMTPTGAEALLQLFAKLKKQTEPQTAQPAAANPPPEGPTDGA